MATAADAQRIRQLRQETVAAIDQRARLAHRIRGELLRLIADGLICVLRALRNDEIRAGLREAADILEPVMIGLGLGACPASIKSPSSPI